MPPLKLALPASVPLLIPLPLKFTLIVPAGVRTELGSKLKVWALKVTQLERFTFKSDPVDVNMTCGEPENTKFPAVAPVTRLKVSVPPLPVSIMKGPLVDDRPV